VLYSLMYYIDKKYDVYKKGWKTLFIF